ncbi:fumarylacetoacetate hydrolase family protein [Streptomyces sp. NBC_00481]|uniref:fumarylacetoacetate hydrolase family protein n=1 Tax=unclassified Streptomyces TaxID=2593676 RepID=UPI002DD97715|nr:MULTISPECIES: fumarylacetoacetate hydrolase family protein [unclassified Streptomyces]WRZ00858.1 fumarylacetoacetate hydrolase family protein [Streptomyces sp. NBC_00481]
MKLLRVGAPGEERPAVRTDDGRLLDPSSVACDIDGAFLASGGVARARAAVETGGLPELDLEYSSQWDLGTSCETFNPMGPWLVTGDVINTGTPAGVALGLPGTSFLCPGDTVELSIDGLGSQRQIFGQA